MRVKVYLETMNDVAQFVAIASQIDVPVHLVGHDLRVSAKSLLGALYTMEWEDVWCECEQDIYTKIKQFVD